MRKRSCATAEDWHGIGLMSAFESLTDAVEIEPAISLALTHDGKPRVVVLGKDETGARQIAYFACDAGCDEDNWSGSLISNSSSIGAGLDLALDAHDLPRFATRSATTSDWRTATRSRVLARRANGIWRRSSTPRRSRPTTSSCGRTAMSARGSCIALRSRSMPMGERASAIKRATSAAASTTRTKTSPIAKPERT